MERKEFWRLIAKYVSIEDLTRNDLARLRDALAKLSPLKIRAFHRHTWALIDAADFWDLWGAAYLLKGGCSDDSWVYFRGWLVAAGRTVYEAALECPDALAGADIEFAECEEMLGVASQAYRIRTGARLEDADVELTGTTGHEWDFEDEAEAIRRLPVIWSHLQELEGEV